VAFRRLEQDSGHTRMKAEFYPGTDKSKFSSLGYIAGRFGAFARQHCRHRIVPERSRRHPFTIRLCRCAHALNQRPGGFDDGAIDFGIGYDCFDERAATRHPGVAERRAATGSFLRQYGTGWLGPYAKEWLAFHFGQRTVSKPGI